MPDHSGQTRFFAYVMKRTEFGEGHLALTLLDRERGRIEICAFGSSKEKSSRRSSLLAGYLIEGVISRKTADFPYSLKEASLVENYPLLMQDLSKIALFYLVFEILDRFASKDQPFFLFDSLRKCLNEIENNNEPGIFAFYFIIKYFIGEGLLPDPENPDELFESLGTGSFKPGGGTIRFIQDCLQNDSSIYFAGKKISASVHSDLITFVSLLYRCQTGKTLSSLTLFTNKL